MRVLLISLVLLTGCATGALRPDPGRIPRVILHPDGTELTELRGHVHVHSKYSHDSDGQIGHILDGAAKTGSDFVIVTDHDTRHIMHQAKRYEWRGRDVLLMAGIEYSTQRGHLLDLFPRADFDPKLPVQELIDGILASGGLPIVAHPNDAKKPWQSWESTGVQGLEVYNTVSDIREDRSKLIWRLFRSLFGRNDPVLSSIDWPRQNLLLWSDQASKGRRLVGVGASNAHGFEAPGRVNWDDYENSFALLGNRVWVRSVDEPGIEEAIRAGRFYVAFDALGDPAGFEFRLRREDGEWLMGDPVPAAAEKIGTLVVRIPYEGQIFLYRGLELVQVERGHELVHEDAGPGSWRVEVARRESMFGEWLPWIISNFIHID